MNKLTHLDEFNKLLADFKVSDDSHAVLEKMTLVLLTAISSTGRNTIIRKLVKTGDYHFIISDTTRHPRINDGRMEQSGVEYWFKSEEEVLDDIKNGQFLEAAVIHNQQVSGISMRELRKAQTEGKVAVTDIEVSGVKNIVGVYPKAIAIFLLPPSYEEWMRRIQQRGEMSQQELRNRMESAQKELSVALNSAYFWFVLNDDIEIATQEIDAIAKGKIQIRDSSNAQMLAKNLLERISRELA